MLFNISTPGVEIQAALQDKINQKTKPIGALGKLENIALQVGCIQQSLNPQVRKPCILVFAADHGIAAEGVVNPYPQSVTAQMVYNFIEGGAAINVFTHLHQIDLKVIDAGVAHHFDPGLPITHAKLAYGTKNYRHEPAMSKDECVSAIQKGAELAREMALKGSNTIGFGEMGIGNTSAASLLMSALCHEDIETCTGAGTSHTGEILQQKITVLKEVQSKHAEINGTLDILATFGGFEIAMMVGAMLAAAEQKMILVIDGFIVSTALLVASKLFPGVLHYCIYAHTSDEKGHRVLLDYLGAEPLLQLNMRLGEGTGAALAIPLIQSAVAFLNQMSSFESAKISNIPA
ncbi:nicotinate-nucleotide--dimethylbenzimidazole phosphoribosyltransferase [Chitinophaga caeni]|uniref:Nicotinate-nucleotide--dimethylbenzimidazole phosphoribosyltransferase n=1 Tax=Chitinophaga caeni TaxID=2029983 RepID=A0A291QQE2_9BACT|nr:nicotinate-nucleotide--dimethylbenzimidazole phosphoribosyltransferase [Chitinophaga caeni]ATL46229.1 nicotinate-nucleotide--dimethylbenzimidazole phosphoribosyltransferase [Chitinophaga caeni]